MILALDASTKTVGWCLLNDDGSLYDIGYIMLDKVKDEYDKLEALKDGLLNSLKISGQVSVFIEAPLARSNNQNVVNILNVWSGMIRVIIHQIYGVKPILIPEMTARKLNGIKVPKGIKGRDKKKFVFEYVRSLGMFPEEKVEFKRTGNHKDYVYDQSDAVVIALAGWKMQNAR